MHEGIQQSFFVAGSAAMTSDRSDWETPRELFKRLDAFWHFDLDVASSDANALCECHFTREDDGLAQRWSGHRVWCNPPYGRGVGDWCRKAYEETRDGITLVIMLIPARTDTSWYHDWIQGKAAEVKFLRGRLKYTLGGGASEFGAFPVNARAMGRRVIGKKLSDGVARQPLAARGHGRQCVTRQGEGSARMR